MRPYQGDVTSLESALVLAENRFTEAAILTPVLASVILDEISRE